MLSIDHEHHCIIGELCLSSTVFLKDCQDVNTEEQTMAVVVTNTDLKIALEGEEVMTGLQSMVQGFAMLFGLIYILNMQYPKKCECTFEFIQKVLMGLDNKKKSAKEHKINVLLHSK